jgi:ABC-type nitrate/sulfonate/bicarbonate transport system substrate-binding protein
MTQLRLALDWIPNTLHAGFLIAQAKNWLQEADLQVRFLSPADDRYATTPVEKLLRGQADLAIAPSEYVIANHVQGKGDLVAVATLLQDDVSVWATVRRGKIVIRPVYAALGLPFEQWVIEQFKHYQPRFKPIKAQAPPNKLDTWEALKSGQADWCWIYLPWEGVEATSLGLPLETIRLADVGVPYGYCPLLIATKQLLEQQPEALADFVRLSAAGYFYAADYPKEAAELLKQMLPDPPEWLYRSLIEVNKHALQADGAWGLMERKRWDDFVHWLRGHGAITKLPNTDKLFTNNLLVENSFWS